MRNFYFADPWLFGANFIPSCAINQLEMWQAETFAPEVIERELGYAARIGMNVMRVFLHDLLWEQDAEGLMTRMDQYLSIADGLGIKTLFVFFDDCWMDQFALGRQPAPIPGSHNSGWVKSPGTVVADDLAQRPRLERYVKGVLTRFADDRRIVGWDLYNEPGNGTVGDHLTDSELQENRSLRLLEDVFRWAKEVSPSQPYTVGVWNMSKSFRELNRVSLACSDIVSFHGYGNKEAMADLIAVIKEAAGTRPVICTEYMARHLGSTFADILPLLKENRVSAVNWGLVSGKTQTIYPWDSYQAPDRYEKPFHDVFHPDGRLLISEEAAVFEQYTM